MSLFFKRMIMLLLGALGAIMLWPFLLTIQYFQSAFPSFLLYTLAQGMALGMFFGAIFGSFEGIVVSSRIKAWKGMGFGCAFGALSGAVGVLAGQALLFLLGAFIFKTNSARFGTGLAIANGAGWVIIGVFLAMTEGLRARSGRKVLVGLAGGLLGGLSGGIALDLLQVLMPGNRFALLAGLLLFGVSLSFFYSFLENRFSSGTLKLLNGPLKGKEYLIVNRKMTVGRLATCDIVLDGYPDVQDVHATLSTERGKVKVSPFKAGMRVLVNEEIAKDESLRREDVVAVGKAKFMYGFFA